MLVRGLIEEDYVQYKKPSMVIVAPTCNWKCGAKYCQNTSLMQNKPFRVSPHSITDRYLDNPLTKALVFSGLEPFCNFEDNLKMITHFRQYSKDDIVIYTGHEEDEIEEQISQLTQFVNIYVKFGRFIPNHESHFDSILGIYLASDNQYGKKIS